MDCHQIQGQLVAMSDDIGDAEAALANGDNLSLERRLRDMESSILVIRREMSFALVSHKARG